VIETRLRINKSKEIECDETSILQTTTDITALAKELAWEGFELIEAVLVAREAN